MNIHQPNFDTQLQAGEKKRTGQSGAALLATTSLLLVVASVGVLTMAEISRAQQRTAGNELRLKEVYSVASGSLEYAQGWLRENFASVTFSDGDGDGHSESGDSAAPLTLPDVALNTDRYSRSVTYTLLTSVNPTDAFMPRIIEIEATATAVNDSHVSKTLRSTAMLASTGIFSDHSASQSGFSGPPLIIENCLAAASGSPSFHPLRSVSIGTTEGNAGDSCLPTDRLNLNSGVRQALSPPRTLWQTVFRTDLSEADLLRLQELAPSRVFFVDDNFPYFPALQPGLGARWETDAGSVDEPIILYFAADQGTSCSRIDIGTVIHGLVYYADDDCISTGFAGGTIHGTLAKAGNAAILNAGTTVFGTELAFREAGKGDGRSIDIGISKPVFTVLPGSWRDF